jgi:hypothetical protein
MRLVIPALLLFDCLLVGQTPADAVADKMLARVEGARWGAPYDANHSAGCPPKTYQQAFGADDEWNDHCETNANGLIEESYFFAFTEAGPLLLKMEVRPEPAADVEVVRALRERLTKRFGAPVRETNMVKVGLPASGERWASGNLHYFLFQNPPGMHVGVKGAVRLVVIDSRLFQEIQRDVFVQQADVLFYPQSPARPFLRRLLGDDYIGLIDADPKTGSERPDLARQVSDKALGLLGVANRALMDERSMLLLAANGLVTKLTTLLWEADETGRNEVASIRAGLAKFDVKLGGMLHNGSLAYNQDLLWRVWREFPESQAGQLAFLELQQRGWSTDPGEGCPANPDLFHEVIEHGEKFLAQRPSTQFRKEVLFTLAVANESWWSVAHAAADDGWVSGIPYPRKELNKKQAAAARERAIHYYQEIVKLAPDSPEAASAGRRLPRLKLGLDTGQRRFFCSFD